MDDEARGDAVRRRTSEFATQVATLGPSSANLDRALQLAADLEDEELIRRASIE